jgi:hypothetical protein
MTSIAGPAIEAEVEYRRERITEDFRRSRTPRKVPAARDGHTPKPRLTARNNVGRLLWAMAQLTRSSPRQSLRQRPPGRSSVSG